MKNIGLFGGSFNPIHYGHLAMARLACESFELDHLFLIPTAEHPFGKESLTISAEDRASMVECAVQADPHLSCWRGEMNRTGASYAIDTVDQFHREYPNATIYYMIGADNLNDFHKWHRFEELLQKVVLIVASRPGNPNETYGLVGDIRFFPSPDWALASSALREYLAKGLSCRYLIHDEVRNYIEENRLYR